MKRNKRFGTRYPWAKWFSQKRFVLVRGKHFKGLTHAMAGMVRNNAPAHNVSVSIRIAMDGKSLDVVVTSANGRHRASS